MKVYEIKNAIDAERKAKEDAFKPITVDGVETPDEVLHGLELPDFSGIPSDVLFAIADISYRVAGVRTSRLVQSDAEKEIGGLVAYLLDADAKNKKQRETWLIAYVNSVSRLVGTYRTNPTAFDILDVVADLRAESAEEVAYRLLKASRGNVAKAIEQAKTEGREIPKWVFNKALERLTAEIFARMA